MAAQLIEIPRSQARLEGAVLIEPGYTKGHTAAKMRSWADDLARYHRTSLAERTLWRSLPPERLTDPQRGVLRIEDKLYRKADLGIKGDLRDDRTVELDWGRHRAGYMLERGVDPIPVWVASDDARRLETFRIRCEQQVERDRGAAPRLSRERNEPSREERER
jgi:hypothetical protein